MTIKQVSCGCCTNGCTCVNHMDIPQCIPPRTCPEHRGLRVGRMLAHVMVAAQWRHIADHTDHMSEPWSSRFRDADAALARVDGVNAMDRRMGALTPEEQRILDEYDLL